MEPEGLLPYSQNPTTGPHLHADEASQLRGLTKESVHVRGRNMITFFTPRLEDHPLSAVLNGLCSGGNI
jgi:hypothetical protein